MAKWQVVLKETVLHTVFVEAGVTDWSGASDMAEDGFIAGDLVDTDAEQLDLEVIKLMPMEETNAEV